MTDKVSTAPEDVERLAKFIEDHGDPEIPDDPLAADTLRALSAKVEGLKAAFNGATDTIAILLYKAADKDGIVRISVTDQEDFERPESIEKWQDRETMDLVFKITKARAALNATQVKP